MDVRACAVREAVGPDIALMLDGYHWYSRSDALYIGREPQKLNFSWFEEPMEEQSMAFYCWLRKTRKLTLSDLKAWPVNTLAVLIG